MLLNKYLSLKLGFLLIASVISSDLRRILPPNLKIREGEDLQLRLTRILPETTSCYVKTPSLTSYNLKSKEPDSASRISYWTENGECGVLARSVTKEDAGRWRLTAKNSNDTLVDSVSVEILDKVGVLERNFSIEGNLGYTLSLEEESKYCWIHQPHSDDILLVNGKCKVELEKPTAAVEGTWLATTGVIGQLKEVSAKAGLSVSRVRLATGFVTNNDTNTISAYCNLRDSDQGLEFCRFAKPDDAKTGFQLSDGLRSGRYGYYGAGLEKGECGITIEAPTLEDYGQWLCTVGVKDEEPFGSYVQIYSGKRRIAESEGEALSASATTTSLGEKLQLRCETTVPLSYCWFRGPDGEIFAIRQSTAEENASYKYIGNGFGNGQCGIEIKTAEAKHEGPWTCHMGPEESGFELKSTVNVRITETPLAANDAHITISYGETLTIECRTVPERIAIDYCRFYMPDGTGVHIGDDITENNPLLLDGARYWFSGISSRFGGCGLKVDKISSKHFGKWTCAARLELTETNTEALDTIIVERGEPSDENPTAGAAPGIISGVVVLVLILVGVSVYGVKRFKARRAQDNISRMEIVSIPTSSRRSSNSTNSSIAQDTALNNARG